MYKNAENGLRLLLQIINILMQNPQSRIYWIFSHLSSEEGVFKLCSGMLQGDWRPQNIWEKKYFI